MTKAAMKRDALLFANALRAKQGAAPLKSLRKGWTHDTGGCAVARTANVKPDGKAWSIGPYAACFDAEGKEVHRVQTPQPVLDFMAAFDAGEFPALMIPVDELVTT